MSIERTASRAGFRMASTKGQYTPPGGGAPSAVRVVVDRGVERKHDQGYDSYLSRQTEGDFWKASIEPEDGGTLIVGDEEWTIGDIVEEDQFIVTHALIEVVEEEGDED